MFNGFSLTHSLSLSSSLVLPFGMIVLENWEETGEMDQGEKEERDGSRREGREREMDHTWFWG